MNSPETGLSIHVMLHSYVDTLNFKLLRMREMCVLIWAQMVQYRYRRAIYITLSPFP
jgi:hypothetical protein